MRKLGGIRYYGGKNANSNTRVGVWIAERLPWKHQSIYIEPFAGMLGVLLQRRPVNLEIVNDLNSDLVNWWLTVRDDGEKFAERLKATPYSREIFNQSREFLKGDAGTRMARAIAYHVLLSQSINIKGGWRIKYSSGGAMSKSYIDLIPALQDRMIDVLIENRDALGLIDRTRSLDHVVMYLDPPYEGADVAAYDKHTCDTDALRTMLGAADTKAKIAISGYGDTFDPLEWQRHEKEVQEYARVRRDWDDESREKSSRTEVLWTNYDANEVLGPLFANHYEDENT